MKMELSNGIIFLTGLVLAIAYGKKHESNLIDNKMLFYIFQFSIDNVIYGNN